MTLIAVRTVLFADLRGSTALFETLGNAEATSVVTHCVGGLTKAVQDAAIVRRRRSRRRARGATGGVQGIKRPGRSCGFARRLVRGKLNKGDRRPAVCLCR